LGTGSLAFFLWLVLFFVLAAIGIAWQWRRYRNLDLFGMGGPAEMPAAKREAPIVDVAATLTASEASAASAVEAEAAVPSVGAVAPVAAVAAVSAEEAATPAEEQVIELAPEVPEEQPVVEDPVVDEVVDESPVVEEVVTDDISRMAAPLDGTEQATLQQKIDFVEGIGPAYASRLNEVGIQTVLDLLHRGATTKGRAELVEATGIAAGLILKWVNHADLFRVKGVGGQFGELLEAAGVDTVPELAQRNSLNLFNKLSEVNAEKKLAGRSPHQAEVENWVAQAKNLPRIVEY
jgi:predicted flap endonuclease-1-like 5' DNA nuclease